MLSSNPILDELEIDEEKWKINFFVVIAWRLCGGCPRTLSIWSSGRRRIRYEDCRTYGIDFNLKGQEWVDWMVEVYRQSLRVCKGLVAFVVQGKTRQYKWSCTPALLIADLHRAGFNVRRPVIFSRSGIPGSGGPDWLRCTHEYIICVTKPGRLPWSDNTACGNPPLYEPGGDPTHRKQNGERVRKTKPSFKIKAGATDIGFDGQSGVSNMDGTITRKNGSIYKPPEIANPGDIVHCPPAKLGSKIAHENEAPFPEKLAEFFIKSFCPPQGITLDPFVGSGTTVAVAKRLGRSYIGIDVRQSQIDLTLRRLTE